MTLARTRNGSKRYRGDGLRRCIGCGFAHAPEEMVRFHVSVPGKLTVDVRHRGPGRGTYVCYDGRCLEAAFRKQRLFRALKVSAGSTAWAEVQGEMVRQLESLARYEFLRAWRLGAVAVPILPDLPEADVHHILSEMGCQVLFISQRQLEKIYDCPVRIPHIVTLDDSRDKTGLVATQPFSQFLAEAEERRRRMKAQRMPKELGGRGGPEPTRYGDWEKNGIISDF